MFVPVADPQLFCIIIWMVCACASGWLGGGVLPPRIHCCVAMHLTAVLVFHGCYTPSSSGYSTYSGTGYGSITRRWPCWPRMRYLTPLIMTQGCLLALLPPPPSPRPPLCMRSHTPRCPLTQAKGDILNMPALAPGLALGLGWDARTEQPAGTNVFLHEPRAVQHRDVAGNVTGYLPNPGIVAVSTGDTHVTYSLEEDAGFAKHREDLNLSASLAMKVSVCECVCVCVWHHWQWHHAPPCPVQSCVTRGLLDLLSLCHWQFMGGALEVSGSASYIKDVCDNSNTARLIFTWTSRSRTERLETEYKSVVTNYCSSVVREGSGLTPPVRLMCWLLLKVCWVSARQCNRMSHSLAPVHSWASACRPTSCPPSRTGRR